MKEKKRAYELLPQDERSKIILKLRADQLLQSSKPIENQKGIPYLCFKLNNEGSFGLPLNRIKEVLNNVSLVKIPRTPSFISGVINRHGDLLSVIDLCQLFNLTNPNKSIHSSIIVAQSNNYFVGLEVEQLEETKIFDPTKITNSLDNLGGISSNYLLGLHSGRIAILNLESIIQDVNKKLQAIE